MAGLLGDYTPDPLAQGLLGLGSALLTPRQMGGGLAAGAQAFNHGAMQAQMMRRQAEQDALRRQLIAAQIGEIGAQAEQRKVSAKAAEARAQQEADMRARQESVWDVLRGGPSAVAAQTGSLAPTNANAALLGRPPQITPQLAAQAAAAGIPLETLRGVVQAGDWTKRKAVREVTVKGPDGSPRTILVDEFGQPVGDGFDQPVKRDMVNTGGAITPVNPYTQAGPLPITMSAAERDASARGWANNAATLRGQDMADARAREANAIGKAPAGYRVTPDGNLAYIPGGPADPATKADKAPTEAQSKDYLFATRADAAHRIIEGLKSPSVFGAATTQNLSGIPLIGGGIAAASNMLALGPETQKYMQAKRDFINAVLRKESGAVIGKDEFVSADQQYFPQPGEGAAVIRQKSEARRRAIDGIMAGAGPLARQAAAASPASDTSITDLLRKYGNAR